MPLSVKHGGVHKDGEVWVRQGSAWKRGELWVRQGGIWKLGAAALTYTPPPGNHTAEAYYSVYFTVTASAPVTWTFSRPPNVGSDVNSGATSTSITFFLDAEPPVNLESGVYVTRTRTVNLTATSNGQSSTFNINLTALGD